MDLTTTSYAILGLLDIRDWTAYDLAQQAGRSLAFTWPVSESQLYAEPKRLAAEGLITIEHAAAGPRRRRQEYSITASGRQALRDWLATEPAAPRIQVEVMLRCLFAASGSRDDLLAALRSTRESVTASYMAARPFVEEYEQGLNPFPERLHTNLLWMTLVRDLHVALLQWADGAIDLVSEWQDLSPDEPIRTQDRLHDIGAPGRARGLHT